MSAESKSTGSNHLYIDHTIDKIFLWNNRFDTGLFDEPNASGEFTLSAGTVVGRIASSGKLKVCDKDSTDGSQFPIGIVQRDYTMAESATDETVSYCISGDVAEEKLVFSGDEDLDSVVTVVNDPAGTPSDTSNTRRMRDLIQAVGIRLISCDDLTEYDNS